MTALSPESGRIALVRQRRYLVENVTPSRLLALNAERAAEERMEGKAR